MVDDTRPDPLGRGLPEHEAAVLRWLAHLCPGEIHDELRSLRGEGASVLAQAQRWAGDVRAAIDSFEVAVREHDLNDEHHRALAEEAGVGALYGLLDEFAEIPMLVE